jgi:hypothetical protein
MSGEHVRMAAELVAAKVFMDLVLSVEGQRVLERHGFAPAAASNP